MIRYLRLVILLAIAAPGMLPCRATDNVDSLLQEMLHFINPDTKLSKQERRLIQDRINGFPQKIVRRDTTTFFLHTAYAIAYYEFSTHEYKKALKWVEDFNTKTAIGRPVIDMMKYAAVNSRALQSLTQKIHPELKEPSSLPSLLDKKTSEEWEQYQEREMFLSNFIEDVPSDWSLSAYSTLLNGFNSFGGSPFHLGKTMTGPGFMQSMKAAGRIDVIQLVYDIWDASPDDFIMNEKGDFEYQSSAPNFDTKYKDELLRTFEISLYPDKARQEIDSLLKIHQTENIAQKILYLIWLEDGREERQNVIKDGIRYKQYLTPELLGAFHYYQGSTYDNLGRFNAALKSYDDALSSEIANETFKSRIRMDRAVTLGRKGYIAKAIAIFMEEKPNLSNDVQRFRWNDNLAYLYTLEGSPLALHYYTEAEKYLIGDSLSIKEKVTHYCRKARLLSNNRYLQRLDIEEALRISDNPMQLFPIDIPKGMAYTEMGAFYSATFNYAEAERYFQKAREAFGDLDKEDILFEYLDLQQGINLRKLGDYEASWNMLWQLLLREQQKYGESYKDLYKVAGEIIKMAAEDIELQYDFNFLYEAYLQQRNQYTTTLDFDDVMTDIAYHYWTKDWDKVAELIAKAMEYDLNPIDKLALWVQYDDLGRRNYFDKSYADRLMYMLPAIQQELPKSLLTLSGDERRALQKPLMQITDGMIHTWAYLQALDLVILRKGLLLSTRRSVEQRLATDKKTKQRYADLTDSRRRLNDAISFNDTTHIPTLKTEVWKKENELYHSLSEDKEVLQGILKDAKDVQKSLRIPDIALEFTTYTNDGTPSYGVFVIYAYGVKAFEDLGPQKEVEADPSIIWQRLDRHLKDARKIYFCTDGQLNTIPIEYLPYDDGRPICDVYRLHRVFHLAEISQPQYIGDNLMLIGVADHNSPIGEAETLYRGTMTDLYNIDYELNLIREAAADRNVTCLFNDEATEGAVKSISGTPVTTLHISTHGFFRDENALTAAATDPADYDHYMARRALSAGRKDLSGLVLREGNLSWRSPVIMDENDGLLTSEEIETMSFPDLRLTVLSACESGLGATDPEGVWGLQRAFRAAGTKNLICTLSQVDDYYTAQFMDIFYHQAAAGASVYDAFHTARRWLRHEQPDRPELWSAFILIE